MTIPTTKILALKGNKSSGKYFGYRDIGYIKRFYPKKAKLNVVVVTKEDVDNKEYFKDKEERYKAKNKEEKNY